MSTGPFSQATVVHALTVALANQAQRASIYELARTVAPDFPDVPFPALRVLAAAVMRVYFNPMSIEDVDRAGINPNDAFRAVGFFAENNASLGHELARFIRDREHALNLLTARPT